MPSMKIRKELCSWAALVDKKKQSEQTRGSEVRDLCCSFQSWFRFEDLNSPRSAPPLLAAFDDADSMSARIQVNLVDSGTGAMVWRGMASGDVDANASPEKHDKKIHEVVRKIFRSYPPKE